MPRAEPREYTAAVPITRTVLQEAAINQYSHRLIEINSGHQVFKDSHRGNSNFNSDQHDKLLEHLKIQSQQPDSDIQRYLEHAGPFLKALQASNRAALAEQRAYQSTAEKGDRSTFYKTGHGRDVKEQHLSDENIQTDHLKLLTVYILRHPSVQDFADVGSSPEAIMKTFKSRSTDNQDAPLGLNPHAVQLMALTQQYGQVASTQDRTKTLSGLFPSRLCTETAFEGRSLQIDHNGRTAHASASEVITGLKTQDAIQTRDDGLSVGLTENLGPRTAHHENGQNLMVDAFDLNLSIDITVSPYDRDRYDSIDSKALLSFGDIAQVTQAEGTLSLTSDHLTLITATSLLGSTALTSRCEQDQNIVDENAILWRPLSQVELQAQINRATILLHETMRQMPELQSLLEAYEYENIDAVFDTEFQDHWLQHAMNPQLNPQNTLPDNSELMQKQKLLLFISRCHITNPTQQQQICELLKKGGANHLIKHYIEQDNIDYEDFKADEAGNTSDQLLTKLTKAYEQRMQWQYIDQITSDKEAREFQKNLNTKAITAGTVVCLALVVLTVSPISWFTPGIAATCLLSGTGIATWLNIRRKLFNSPNISSYNLFLKTPPYDNAVQQIAKSQKNALKVILAVVISLISTAAVFFPTLPGTMYTLATQAISSAMMTPLGIPIALLAMTSMIAVGIASVCYKGIIKRSDPGKSRKVIAGIASVLIALIISTPAILPLVLTGLSGTIIGATSATAFTSILMGLGILAAIALTVWVFSTSIYRFSKGTTQSTDAKIIQSILKAQKTVTPEALRVLSPPVSDVSDVSSGSSDEDGAHSEHQAQPSHPSSIVDALFNHTIALTDPEINDIQESIKGEDYLGKFKRETFDSEGNRLAELAEEGADDDLSSLPEDTQSAIAALLFQSSPIAPAQILDRAKTMTANHANPLGNPDDTHQVEVISRERDGETTAAQISLDQAQNTVTVSQTKTYKVTNQDTGKVVSIPMTASTTLTLSHDQMRVISAKTQLTTLSTEHQAAISRVIVAERITQDQALHTGEQGTHGGYAPIAQTMADQLETYLKAITQEALKDAPDTEEASRIAENMDIRVNDDAALVEAVETDDALASPQDPPARVSATRASVMEISDATVRRSSDQGLTVSDTGDDASTSPPSNKAKYAMIGVGVSLLAILMIGSAINIATGLLAIKAIPSIITLVVSSTCLLGVGIYACTRKDSSEHIRISTSQGSTDPARAVTLSPEGNQSGRASLHTPLLQGDARQTHPDNTPGSKRAAPGC